MSIVPKGKFCMTDFNHFLITRFNVHCPLGLDGCRPDKSFSGIADSYLRYRFSFFDAYCYPTVRSQTKADFKWLVFFDSHTPQRWKDKIGKYSECPNFVSIFIDIFDEKGVHDAILRHAWGNPRYLITTRLDNDDGICRDYVRLVQDAFVEEEGVLINFFWGRFLVHPAGRLYLRGRCVNTFASLIEKSEDFHTIFFAHGLPHHKLKNLYQSRDKLRNIMKKDQSPAWLVVFHGKNVGNSADIYNAIRVPRKGLLRYFDLAIPVDERESGIEIMLERLAYRLRLMNYWVSFLTRLKILGGKIRRILFRKNGMG